MKYFLNKKFSSLNLIPNIKSVVNIEREDFYPFLHPLVKNYLPQLKKKSSTYAKVYPKDIIQFLQDQEKQFENLDNIEVIYFITQSGYLCREI